MRILAFSSVLSVFICMLFSLFQKMSVKKQLSTINSNSDRESKEAIKLKLLYEIYEYSLTVPMVQARSSYRHVIAVCKEFEVIFERAKPFLCHTEVESILAVRSDYQLQKALLSEQLTNLSDGEEQKITQQQINEIKAKKRLFIQEVQYALSKGLN